MTRGETGIKKVILTVLLTAVLSAAAVLPAAAEDITVTVAALKGPSGFAAAGLLNENFQPGYGVRAEYIIVSSPVEAIAKMTSGQADGVFLPVNTAAKLYSKGPGFKLAAVSGLGSLYMVSSDPDVKDWADLKGKKIYITGKGATPDYLLRYILEKNGLNPDRDVTLDFTAQAPQVAQLLIAGKADTAFIPQPFVMQTGMKNPAVKIVLDPQEELKDLRGGEQAFPFTAFVISPRLSVENPEAARALSAALERSINWVLEDPKAAGQVIEKYGIMAASTAASAIPLTGIKYISAQDAMADVVDFLGMFMELDPVSLGGSLPDEGFYFK